jgi:hypothetical protein
MGPRPPQPKKFLEGGTGRQFSRSVKKIFAVVGTPPQKISWYVLALSFVYLGGVFFLFYFSRRNVIRKR